ncbi:MAG: metal ABC transporter substrate-binding protein [Bdellovibrionales bacterium]
MGRVLTFIFFFIFFVFGMGMGLTSGRAQAQLMVGTTTPDLEALVKAVGGEDVSTFSVVRGTQDPHQIEAKPSFMVKFRGADLIVSHGLDLESAWLDPMTEGSRNPRIARGTPGFLELGPLLKPIEVKSGPVSRAEGDIHPDGNPHFHLDPVRLGQAAVIVAVRMGDLAPKKKEPFRVRARNLQKRLEEKTKDWTARIRKTGIKEFVSYHKTFSYFADRFGLKNTLHLEPKPGIPPSPSHVLDLIESMKARNVKLILIENFFDDSVRGKFQQAASGVKVLKVPVYVGGEDGVTTNEELIERLVRTFEEASK